VGGEGCEGVRGGLLLAFITFCWRITTKSIGESARCFASSVGGGNNAKEITGNLERSLNQLNIHPDPFQHAIKLNLSLYATKKIDIIVFNSLGKIVHNFEVNQTNNAEISIDFDKLALPYGLYLISCTIDGNKYYDKAIYQR
jgi:hypothetical protein